MSENLSVSTEDENYKYVQKISLITFVFKRFKFNLEALLLPSQNLQPLSLGLPSVGTKRNQITTHEGIFRTFCRVCGLLSVLEDLGWGTLDVMFL